MMFNPAQLFGIDERDGHVMCKSETDRTLDARISLPKKPNSYKFANLLIECFEGGKIIDRDNHFEVIWIGKNAKNILDTLNK